VSVRTMGGLYAFVDVVREPWEGSPFDGVVNAPSGRKDKFQHVPCRPRAGFLIICVVLELIIIHGEGRAIRLIDAVEEACLLRDVGILVIAVLGPSFLALSGSSEPLLYNNCEKSPTRSLLP